MYKKSWNGRGNLRYSIKNRCEHMLSAHGVQLKTKEELGGAVGEAWSIGANNQPLDPEYIGSRRERDDTHHYFKDIDGTFYFLSDSSMELEKELERARRERMAMRAHGQG